MNDTCCEAWLQAQEDCTDNEAWRPLIDKDDAGNWRMGSMLPPVRFCPWCGRPKAEGQLNR